MSRPALPEERGADLQLDPLTLEELRQAHDWRSEDRDRYESGDSARTVDVCRACGYEQDVRDRGAGPACSNEEIPGCLIEIAERFDLLSALEHANHADQVAIDI